MTVYRPYFPAIWENSLFIAERDITFLNKHDGSIKMLNELSVPSSERIMLKIIVGINSAPTSK